LTIEEQWRGWPSTRDDEHWPGAWRFGNDYTGDEGCWRVIAMQFGGEFSELKSPNWIGPIDIRNEEHAVLLESWAHEMTRWTGGYVHLFPCDGDMIDELRELVEEWQEEEDDEDLT